MRVPKWLCGRCGLHFCNIENLIRKIKQLKMSLLAEQIYYGATTPSHWITQLFMVARWCYNRLFQISLQFKNQNKLAGRQYMWFSNLWYIFIGIEWECTNMHKLQSRSIRRSRITYNLKATVYSVEILRSRNVNKPRFGNSTPFTATLIQCSTCKSKGIFEHTSSIHVSLV